MAWSEYVMTACLFLCLLVYDESFCSGDLITATQFPLTSGDASSSNPQLDIYHCLSCINDHLNVTLSGVDITRQLNFADIISPFVQILSVVVLARLAMCIHGIGNRKQRCSISHKHALFMCISVWVYIQLAVNIQLSLSLHACRVG